MRRVVDAGLRRGMTESSAFMKKGEGKGNRVTGPIVALFVGGATDIYSGDGGTFWWM
jgi:hypothetical protein